MENERFTPASGVYLLFIRDQKILLLRRFQTGYEDGNYSLIVGHLNGKETAREAAVREALEEGGVQLRLDALTLVHTMHRNKPGIEEKIEFFFRMDQWEEGPINAEPQKCDDLAWFSYDDLPENIVSYIRFSLDQIRRGQIYSEYGWT